VVKMVTETGQMIELVKGDFWPEHISVDWYDDGQGNYVEMVMDKRRGK
jgi:hypothetical protein